MEWSDEDDISLLDSDDQWAKRVRPGLRKARRRDENRANGSKENKADVRCGERANQICLRPW